MSNVEKPRKKTGRPSLYKPDEHPAAARLLTGNGKTLAEVAEAFDVARSTVEEWMSVHPEFSASIQLGREDATRVVEQALFKRATGFSHPSEKIVVVSDGQGAGSHVERVPIVEQYPPDTEAMKFWLKNRAPKDWRDKQELEHSGKVSLEQILAQSHGDSAPAGDKS